MTIPSTSHSSRALHVVLGGGQIGHRLAGLLAASGHEVRLVQRTPGKDPRPHVTRVSGDITERAFAEHATAGAEVVYDCMNPQYHQWPELLLPLAEGALRFAAKAGARLVALDCLYMYGIPHGPMRENSPRNPCSKKGALRVELEALRMGAQRRGDVAVAIGRASDFFGANLPNSLFSPRFFQRLLAGKPVEVLGNPDTPHTYSYADDVARSLATLGAHEEALGKVWHLPAPAAESTRALCERLGRALDRPVRLRTVPQIVWRAGGLLMPFMREIAEMNYQWEVPYVLDDSRFRAAFGLAPTPVEQAVAETAAWARSTFGAARAA